MTDAAPMPPAIEQFLGSVPQPEAARALRTLCALILAAEPRLGAAIKWNAPSFTLDGRDVVTTGVNRDGSIRLVLHRGAARAAPGTQRPTMDDPDALLEWRGVDRAIATFADDGAVRGNADAVRALVRQWVSTAEPTTA
ncbi:DUF1801 domain-containing protein [Yonghaparkia sp. Root332]|uniref:DUF1801 domain-containing protein n=1 Tax=Yonghaparkia sp. Root332 TaxID=1736516 RepID=UPI00138F58F6|nr:DUF1801 domain-containing protein [Yonghaparkia sp. Root332]